MLRTPDLACLYVSLVFASTFVAYTLLKHKRVPEYTDMAIIILSSSAAVVALELGCMVLTVDDTGLGNLAQYRLPVVLGALAIFWTAIGSLGKTCRQALDRMRQSKGEH